MRCCVVLNCDSPKIVCTQTQGHVSYHRFPHDPITKEKWIEATGRKDWFPTKHSHICSKHFENSSFIEGKKLRMLKKTAYPTINILKLIDDDDENQDTPQQPSSLSRKRKLEETDPTDSSDGASDSDVPENPVIDETFTGDDPLDLKKCITPLEKRVRFTDAEAQASNSSDVRTMDNKTADLSTNGEKGHSDEFQIYGLYVAGQLRLLSEKQSLIAREKIQSILTQCRLQDIRGKRNNSPSNQNIANASVSNAERQNVVLIPYPEEIKIEVSDEEDSD